MKFSVSLCVSYYSFKNYTEGHRGVEDHRVIMILEFLIGQSSHTFNGIYQSDEL